MENIIKEKKRDSNFELLRIISIIMIIFHHFSYHGGFNYTSITINRLWVDFIEIGGKIGVNIFILISGYYLITSKEIKLKKIIKLIGQVLFTSIVIYLIFVIFGLERFSLKGIVKTIMPITFNSWWFVSAYFVLFLLSPFINKFLNIIDKKTFFEMLIVMLFCWCLIPTITGQSLEGNSLLWFIFLYCVAGYIRLYHNDKKIDNKKVLITICLLIILTYCTVVVFDYLGLKYSFIANHTKFFYGMDKLPILIISLLIFMLFKSMTINYSKIINNISKTSFGIYLIHEHFLIRPYIWKNLFNTASFQDSNYLIIYSIAVCIIIYIICMLIELIRINSIEKWFMILINKKEDKITQITKCFFNKKLFNKV